MHALAAQKLFGWYLAPVLGMQPPGLAVFVGLAMFVGLFRRVELDPIGEDEGVEDMRRMQKAFVMILTPAIYLFFGWIIYRLFVA